MVTGSAIGLHRFCTAEGLGNCADSALDLSELCKVENRSQRHFRDQLIDVIWGQRGPLKSMIGTSTKA